MHSCYLTPNFVLFRDVNKCNNPEMELKLYCMLKYSKYLNHNYFYCDLFYYLSEQPLNYILANWLTHVNLIFSYTNWTLKYKIKWMIPIMSVERPTSIFRFNWEMIQSIKMSCSFFARIKNTPFILATTLMIINDTCSCVKVLGLLI